MRITYKHILILIVGYIVYYIYQNIKIVNTPIKKQLIEKVVTSDRYGHPMYYYRWKLKDGTTITEKEDFEFSEGLQVGKTYISNEQTFEFK